MKGVFVENSSVYCETLPVAEKGDKGDKGDTGDTGPAGSSMGSLAEGAHLQLNTVTSNNGTSGSVYKSQAYDSTETQHLQSFVKDASGRIYSTTRSGSYTFRTAKVDFSTNGSGNDV